MAHPALVDRSKIYLPPLHIKRRNCLFKANILQNKWAQNEKKKELYLLHKLNNNSKTMTLAQDDILQREEPGRRLKTSVETF